jgi:hypothetical protein
MSIAQVRKFRESQAQFLSQLTILPIDRDGQLVESRESPAAALHKLQAAQALAEEDTRRADAARAKFETTRVYEDREQLELCEGCAASSLADWYRAHAEYSQLVSANQLLPEPSDGSDTEDILYLCQELDRTSK